MKSSSIGLVLRLGLLLLPLLFLTSCSETEEETKIEATLTSLWDNKFSSCADVCHKSGHEDTQDGPDLSSKTNFYNNMVDKSVDVDYPNWIKSGTCTSHKLIEPNNADNSVLTATMVSSVSDSMAATGCVTSYALHLTNNQTITNQELIDALEQWIDNGAQNN